MFGFQRSVSVHRRTDTNVRKSSEDGRNPNTEELIDETTGKRSSADSFVIPQRTRYPSAKSKAPEDLDTCVARALLERKEQHDQDFRLTSYSVPKLHEACFSKPQKELPDFSHDSNDIPNERETSTRTSSHNHTQRWNSSFFSESNTISSGSFTKDSTPYIELYNGLARTHGLQELESVHDLNDRGPTPGNDYQQYDGPSTPTATKPSSKHWLLNKLVRTPSLVNLKHTQPRLSKKESIGKLFRYNRGQSNVCKSLDDICRLGGVSILHLPSKYSPIELIIPTCLAATANYLVMHGRETPGIFRIPGQNSVVNALYQHYVQRIRKSQDVGEVETTIGSSTLPQEVAFNVHDIASAFKRFIWDFPGGILGSVKLFNILKDIWMLSPADTVPNNNVSKTKLVALALLSLRSKNRIALISAVFGLLAFLKQDEDGDSLDGTRRTKHESMTSTALGVVFAPILLADLTEQVECDPPLEDKHESKAGSATKRSLFGYGKNTKQVRNTFRHKEITASVEKAKICAKLAEYLIRSWEEIVKQFPSLECSSRCQTLASQRIPSGESGQSVIYHQGACDRFKVGSDGCEDYLLVKAASNPLLAGPNRFLKPLPNLPSNETQLKNGMHRSASFSVISRGPSDGLRVQIQTPSGRRHLARSTTALHVSDPPQLEMSSGSNESGRAFTHSQKRQTWLDTAVEANSDDGREEDLLGNKNAQQDEMTNEVSLLEPLDPNDGTFSTFRHNEAQQEYISQPDQSHHENSQDSLGNKNGHILRARDRPVTSKSISVSVPGEEGVDVDGCDSAIAECFHLVVEKSDDLDPVEPTLSTEQASVQAKDACGSSKQRGSEPKTPMPVPRDFLKVPKISPSMIPRPASDLMKAHRRLGSPIGGPREASRIDGSQSSPCRGRSWRVEANEAGEAKRESDVEDATWVRRRRTAQAQSAGTKQNGTPTQNTERCQDECEDERPVARRISFRSPSLARRTTARVSPETQMPTCIGGFPSIQRRHNVGTLYAEIRRLHGLLGAKREEIWQLKQQVEAMKRFRGSRTLTEKLQETEGEMRMWKQRAHWAEGELQGRRVGIQMGERGRGAERAEE